MCLIRTGGEWPRGETCPPRLQKLSCVWRPGIYTHTCLCIHACLCRGGGGSLCFDKSLWCVGWSATVFFSLVWGRGVSSLSLATQSRPGQLCYIISVYNVCILCVCVGAKTRRPGWLGVCVLLYSRVCIYIHTHTHTHENEKNIYIFFLFNHGLNHTSWTIHAMS